MLGDFFLYVLLTQCLPLDTEEPSFRSKVHMCFADQLILLNWQCRKHLQAFPITRLLTVHLPVSFGVFPQLLTPKFACVYEGCISRLLMFSTLLFTGQTV